jgi:hypothetical protein
MYQEQGYLTEEAVSLVTCKILYSAKIIRCKDWMDRDPVCKASWDMVAVCKASWDKEAICKASWDKEATWLDSKEEICKALWDSKAVTGKV